MYSVSISSLILSLILGSCHSEVSLQPEQVHLSLGGKFQECNTCVVAKDLWLTGSIREVIVTWVTLNETSSDPIVEYGPIAACTKFSQTATGYTTIFTDGGSEKRVLYIHRVTLSHLTPGHTYG